jgi:hypothetical protein
MSPLQMYLTCRAVFHRLALFRFWGPNCTVTFRLPWFLLMKLSSLIWCIVGCRIPSDDIFAEKYETKIMRKEMFMDPVLWWCLVPTNDVNI